MTGLGYDSDASDNEENDVGDDDDTESDSDLEEKIRRKKEDFAKRRTYSEAEEEPRGQQWCFSPIVLHGWGFFFWG